jgi:hypothetical protein
MKKIRGHHTYFLTVPKREEPDVRKEVNNFTIKHTQLSLSHSLFVRGGPRLLLERVSRNALSGAKIRAKNNPIRR